MARTLVYFAAFLGYVYALPNQVCIIGSGIGGSSTAYFLRQLLAKPLDTDIHVFEQHDIVGGRMATFENRDLTIEAGGTIFLTKNRYMMHFAEVLNLTLRVPGSNLRSTLEMGIFNGNEIVFQTSPNYYWNTAKLLWRYGIFSLRAFEKVVSTLVQNFGRIYDLQKSGKAFKDPNELLEAIELYHLTKITLEDLLVKEGVGPLLINELLAGITRVNYGQNTTMTALAGAVGLAGSGDALRAVVGGNPQIPNGLLHHARAVIHLKTQVKSLQVHPHLNLETSGGNVECDAIVIATPLELTDIKHPFNVPKREFQTTYTTFIEGEIDASKFGTTKIPTSMLTTEFADAEFSSYGLQAQPDDAPSLYKVFSRKPWTETLTKKWFINGQNVKEFPWKAYPKYTPPEQFAKFELARGVFYVNAIESAASAMEMSSVGGKNAALLVRDYLEESDQSSDIASNVEQHNEL